MTVDKLVNLAAIYAVHEAIFKSSSGNWVVYADDISDALCVELSEVQNCMKLIADKIGKSEVVIEIGEWNEEFIAFSCYDDDCKNLL